jgi:GNAT superfamily N-acetyltransferase
MTDLRPLARDDIPAVARLFSLVWRGSEDAADAELERFFTSTLLDNPWADPELPSLVATDGDALVGMIGSNVRRVSLDGTPLRMVCSAHLVSHPRVRRQAVGARLMKALLAGAQDVTITDGATDEVRRMWEGFGGASVSLGAFSFVRLFRPASLAADLLLGRRGYPLAASPLRHLPGAVDGIARRAARRRLVAAPAERSSTALTPGDVVTRLGDIAAATRFHAAYDVPYLTWLFDELSRVATRGTLWANGVPRGELWAELVQANEAVLGWYICHLRQSGFCRVLQFAAAPRASEAVFAQLSFRAQERGAAALYGRLEPPLVAPVVNASCIVRPSDGRLLIHARDPALVTAVRAGDALLTRMDGEWW